MSNTQVKINRSFRIIREFSQSTILNSYFGGSNLVADHLNDYSSDGINTYIGGWLDENHNKRWNDMDISAYELIDNPDYLIQRAASEFYIAFSHVFNSGRDCEKEFKSAVYLLDQASDNYFVFSEAWSNACQTVYIVQETDIQTAHDKLTDYYTDKFGGDNEEDNAELMDNLQFVGTITIE